MNIHRWAVAESNLTPLIDARLEKARQNIILIGGQNQLAEQTRRHLPGYVAGKDITEITDLIKFFPGRIERDDWVGQAYSLLNDKEE